MAHTCARTGMKILHQWWLETSNANSVVQPVDDVTQFLRPLAPPSQHTDNEVPRGLSQKAELTDLTLHHWMLTLEENRVKLASGDIMMHHDLIKL